MPKSDNTGLLGKGGLQTTCQIIDLLPVPICHMVRRGQRRIFRTEFVGAFLGPMLGYCAAKDEHYFGFKGGLLITDYGLIVHAPLLRSCLKTPVGPPQGSPSDLRIEHFS